ncbi:MAG: fused response regulator/phosphatase [Pseudomonadota bacterium]
MNEINPIESPDLEQTLSWEYESITNSEAPHLVLVVDDSAMQRKMLTKALVKWGYEVIEADSAIKGLELCKSHDVTMVISDWMMPGMNGPQFCHEFRQLDREGYGYFILLTSKGESREVAAGLNSGADDFLIKPFVFGELKARLRAGERIVEMHSQLVHKNRIVNHALETIRTLYDSVQNDLAEARRLQASLVREEHVAYPRGGVSMMLHPSGHVGGDLVGQFEVSENVVGIYSLDVSGHGVASALMAARLAGYLSGLSPSQNIALIDQGDGKYTARDPSETAALLNETLLRELETDHYFTMALAIVDMQTGKVICTQAGHPHPIVRRADGTIEMIGVGGMPIGLIPGAEFENFEFQISGGDEIVLFSDGLTEAEDPNGVQLDEAGLEALLSKHNAQKGTALLETLYNELKTFCQKDEFSDDVSALVFEFKQSDA